MSDLLLLVIFMILLLMLTRAVKDPSLATHIGTLVGALDRRHTDRNIETERSKAGKDTEDAGK